MKIYALEYDFTLITALGNTKVEHRVDTFTSAYEFIEEVKRVKEQWYNSNIKVYSGELNEINIDNVLNPF